VATDQTGKQIYVGYTLFWEPSHKLEQFNSAQLLGDRPKDETGGWGSIPRPSTPEQRYLPLCYSDHLINEAVWGVIGASRPLKVFPQGTNVQ
jgi:hypothetical protein